MTKKIAIIGTVGIPGNYGGFETLTEYLTKNLANDFEITVYCSSKFYKNKLKNYNKATLKYIPLSANGFQSILYDIVSIFNALFFADTLLILGVSGCIVLPIVKVFSNKTIIVNIDGLEWKREKWGKPAKWFLKFSEKLAVKYADTIISDNKVIQQYVQDTYQAKSELIAYGANHTGKETLSDALSTKYPFLNQKYAFKVCRIEPENNIHIILEAFAELKSLALVIIGNWDNSTYGQQLKLEYGSYENIHLMDPIYNQNILDQLRSNCYVYVHGHSAGGTNPSLVEAMYLELPIISFGVNYNRETTKNQAKYFNNKSELLGHLMHLKEDDLHLIAKNMKNVADINYTWEVISQQYASLFEFSKSKNFNIC